MENKTGNKPNYDGLSFGLFLLFVGAIALLANIGLINFSWSTVFSLLATYWPVFVIVLGIKIVVETLPHGKLWGIFIDVIVDILIVLALIFPPAAITQNDTTFQSGEAKIIARSQFPLATQKDLTFNFGAADLTVFDSNSENIVTLIGAQNRTEAKQKGNTVETIIENRINDNVFFNFRSNYQKYQAEVGAQELPTNLSVKLGASKGDFKFDNTSVNDVNVELGAGDLVMSFDGIALPRKVSIKVGAGKAILNFPKSAEVKVNYKVGVGALRIDAAAKNITRTFGGLGASGSYQTAADLVPAIQIEAEVGAGEVEIVMK